ncbi:MAG TPA: double zinc ribbon domain-containing protein [bacterium]|nr:double zinc ribbon domain-containing protein [bacterium]
MYTKVFNRAWYFLLDALFPKRCVTCKKFGVFLCAECAGKVERLSTSVCYECGRITQHSSYCSVCKNRKLLKLNGIIVSAKYESPVKELVAGLKYGGYIEISELLGELIVQRLLNSDIKFEKAVFVPVPLHRSRELVRGFNQSELIARYISKKLNLPGGDALKKN